MSTAPDTTGEHPLDRLWAVAFEWAHTLVASFGAPAKLANVGLSRRLALRCRNWLWSIEGIVRRVLIAAALAFDPRKLSPLRPAPAAAAPRAPRPAKPHPPRFTVFAFAGAPGPARRCPAAEPSRPYAHVPFPSDGLLRIGATRARSAALYSDVGEAAPPRLPHPLRRHGRIPRGDPDFRADPRPAKTTARYSTPRTPSKRNPPVSMVEHLPDLTDWRRVEEEWQRTLPAPQLAARIAALLRVVDRPAPWIRRLARRLHTSNLAARLALQKPPRLRRPKLDRTPPPHSRKTWPRPTPTSTQADPP